MSLKRDGITHNPLGRIYHRFEKNFNTITKSDIVKANLAVRALQKCHWKMCQYLNRNNTERR